MTKWPLACLLWGACAVVMAQPAEPLAAGQIDFDRDFDRIQQTRQQQEVLYEQEESKCYARFSVTSCVHEVRKRRRDSLEMLKKQEVLLRQAQRQHMAAVELQRLKEKTSEERLSQAAAERLDALQAHAQREERARKKAAAQARPAVNEAQVRAKAPQPSRSAAEIALEKQRYQEKLAQAREQRALHEKRLREKSGSRAQPLPPVP